ncbi:hypothetical protein PVAND_005160 [Polypedilum vanderplanki]|uniref:Uncharacterized protein n=1 Tax=Polypedilum vanderplanki TaxID=319348 RepID=A0A9J6C082_POLVA|nr:hypothetical protein PVAND_005160 [Polypedilum vanderplanki]
MKLSVSFKLLYLKIIDCVMKNPKKLIRLFILSDCCIIVFFQLWHFKSKFLWPPTSTYLDFHLNESMYYPAITFCREPSFKNEVMSKYNLSFHPSITTSWKNFPFNETSLADLYEEATYTRDEFFGSYWLDGKSENIDIVMTLHFSYGKCYTLLPLVTTDLPWKQSGYEVILYHDFKKELFQESRDEFGFRQGWNMYLHEPREEFTEYGISSSGRIENLFLEVNEEIELKMQVNHYSQFRGRGSVCSDDVIRSASICREKCVLRYVEDSIDCSGPWMKKPETSLCNNYDKVKGLINEYKNSEKECGCMNPCETTIYSSFVMNRKIYDKHDVPSSKISIYFTSKMVTNLEERSGYDSAQFVADMGGSLSFLLGLSVIGFIIVLEKILGYLFLDKLVENYMQKKEAKKQAELEETKGAKEAKFLDM